MSADVEAAGANPTSVESKDVKAEPVDATSSDKKDTEEPDAKGDDGEKDDKKHPKTAADAIDEKYSKDRKDRNSNYKGKRDNLHKGRNTWNYNSPRDKFDRRNVKSRYDDQEKTDDPAQIRKQVEFYFSDGNLRQDKFLFEQIGGAANKPVDIKVIASFKRMQRFEPYSAIVKALKESSTLDVLNDDKPNGEQVRRKTPLPETMGTDHKQVAADYNTESMKRSIYAKGFGAEDSKTQLRIEELFSIWGVTSVRLRRHADGTFKGSAFIEFPSEDEAQQFLESDAESKPKWNETEVLSIMSKAEYCQMKDKLINEGKIRRNDLDGDDGPRGGFRGGPRGRARGGRWNGNNGGDRGGRYHNKRRRDDSRSRSGERDLENENWRELREKDKAGRKRDKETKQEFDEAGIPKVMSSASENPAASAANGNGKKRAAEDDAGDGEKEVKKAK